MRATAEVAEVEHFARGPVSTLTSAGRKANYSHLVGEPLVITIRDNCRRPPNMPTIPAVTAMIIITAEAVID